MSSSELKPMILYDIPCDIPGFPWSPNTMKTRYCLGYKGLPFTTVWVEYPDIAGLLQSKGITNPPYTLPAIEDPNTGTFTMDSLAIATYLDETYPDTPEVLSAAARAILDKTGNVFSFGSGGGSNPTPRLVLTILATEHLNPVSKEYYHRTRAARIGEPWTTMVGACAASAESRAALVRQGIEAIRGTWENVTALYVREDERSGGPFVLGKEPCILDFDVAGRVKYLLGALTLSEAETVKGLEGGRLARVVEDLERYFKC